MRRIWFVSVFVVGAQALAGEPTSPSTHTVRVAAAQPRARLIDWHMKNPEDVLAKVEQSLAELERILGQAAARHCDVIAFPEDTLGLGHWEAGNEALSREVLPRAVERMLARFGAAAAKHRMYVVCCNDNAEANGAISNTAFLIGRDGKEIGRYHKVNMPIHELNKKRGDRFPVFHTPDLGGVGLLICYDMVFPEAARCLALGGADVIFHPTLGGAAIGDPDISRAAFRTRAVENFVYLVVAQRGEGSLIISPQGKIIAEAPEADGLAVADINPFGGREGGDAMNYQRDMRARLFRERNPAAFGILGDPKPPVLADVPATITEREAVRVAQRVLTVGAEEFQAADGLVRAGRTAEAVAAFTRLRSEYRGSWIDRRAAERLAQLGPRAKTQNRDAPALAEKPPGDAGAEKAPRLIFFDGFEYEVKRDERNERPAFITEGKWSGVKSENSVGKGAGYLYTTNRIPGYAGPFPGRESKRVLAIEARSKTFATQTDFYLQYGNPRGAANQVPGNVWFQFWLYTNCYDDPQDKEDQLSGYGGGKFLYPSPDGNYPTYPLWLFCLGHSSHVFLKGREAPYFAEAKSQDLLMEVTSAGVKGEKSNREFVAYAEIRKGPSYDRWKMGQTSLDEQIVANRWTLVKLHFDTSKASAGWEAWLRPVGGKWVKVAEWLDAVTPDFSWKIPAEKVGGHRVFRMPTTNGAWGERAKDNMDSWRYMDDFAMASSEEELPKYPE